MKRTTDRQYKGFTLIEMLVVIVIIAILTGLVFKLMGYASDRAAISQTAATIEKVRAALEEFYAEYGQYPPVPYYEGDQPVRYEYPSAWGMRKDLTGSFGDQDWNEAPIFTFGLMSYLLPRFEGHADRAEDYDELFRHPQWTTHNSQKEDPERDLAAIKRWSPFLQGITAGDIAIRTIGDNARQAYTNTYVTVRDYWKRELVYHSPPPHQSYVLLSKGPDGKCDLKNPSAPANKDNVVGQAGR